MQASTVAIVTGASRGLGQALALGLMQADTRLTTVARSHDPKLAEQAAASGCTLQQVQSDLANPSAAERVAKQVVAGLPAGAKRYVLNNNAGTVHPLHQANDLDNAASKNRKNAGAGKCWS